MAIVATGEETEAIYAFGGLGVSFQTTLALYNIERDCWEDLSEEGDPSEASPGARVHHELINISDKRLMLFGGFKPFGGHLSQKRATKEALIYDLSTKKWSKTLSQKSFVPPRAGHCFHSIGENVLIFGGESNNGEFLLDCWGASLQSKIPILSFCV